MSEIVQYLMSGLTAGAIYAVIALGYTLLYNATELVNFAQGEFVMLGSLGLFTFLSVLGWPLWAAFPAVTLVVGLLGVVLERLAIRPVKKPEPITLIIITVGASIFLRGLAMLLWGKDPHSVPGFAAAAPIRVLGAAIMPQSLWILAVVGLLMGGLHLFSKHTLTGKAMEACAIHRSGAWILGIPSDRMAQLAFAMSAALGGIGGIIISPITMAGYDMGTMLGLKGFCAAMLGGLGSHWGAVVGGLLLGVLESLGVGFFSSGIKDAIAFLLLLAILMARPSGLLGPKAVTRF
ncbi:amino acid/amide ABC transporter membrane protein 1, HAAT family (TC 3.A.1.4.-) [Desulfacinum hydrothermale DSM 13146]|uniref:Amino acid/amide ABC transporter membrane protein 1, HAAT family (TC 3.A.1.4.-) n=1 Tax=Desulfacinum hydrothermale DSM 13146 TaxID=1121390 RepID=A0A1W1X0A5_9BACT|nr:branched-chain amino acid ABC transporter permease [Desulfacinum hydrothermale]SMC17402.1 amino acid/amide ABC transporter membrane protein 1, HAAT family (TC 3.A.1.4.-) [Desulfacinum hydrothermale DSM 13146]